jgi:acetolactate synthase small subunit
LGQIYAHIDRLILQVIDALEGEQETEIVRHLLRLRNSLSLEEDQASLSDETEAARAEVINIVNNFFYEKLTAMPTIEAYLEDQGGA